MGVLDFFSGGGLLSQQPTEFKQYLTERGLLQ